MHFRPVFAQADLDRVVALVTRHNFGLLITSGAGLDASPVPFTVAREGDGLMLTGHLSAGNKQCAQIGGGTALAVFGGPHAYVSPTWYITQPAVPTWDYAAVHVHGRLEPMTDAADMTAMLRTLGGHDPTFDLDRLPDDYMAGMMRGIRAFRIRSERIETQWKLSQNRSVADREAVVAALRAHGNDEVADLIAATLTGGYD
jgi:transcriptional regulator